MSSPRQRHDREAKALAFLKVRHVASALEIGAAAVRGEPWAQPKNTWKAKAAIGLSIGIALHRRGLVKATRHNKFELVA